VTWTDEIIECEREERFQEAHRALADRGLCLNVTPAAVSAIRGEEVFEGREESPLFRLGCVITNTLVTSLLQTHSLGIIIYPLPED
jgi:hypothetical protein